MATGVYFLLFIVLAIVIRLIAGSMDTQRIQDYFSSRGWRLLEKKWAPFGKGWYGEKSDRIYEVRYLDQEGNTHAASLKTSLFTGVYLTEDRIVSRTQAVNLSEPISHEAEIDDLVAENEQLRRRIEQLEQQERWPSHNS